MTVEALTIKTLDCQSFQTALSQAHKNPIRRGQFGSLDGALQNAELMAEREDLELQRSTAPKGGEKCGQKSGPEVSEGESKEKGQLPVYQSDRILRERHTLRRRCRLRQCKYLNNVVEQDHRT